MCRQRAGCNAGRLTVQAKRRLQPWSSKGWRPEGLVAAAARKPCSSWRIVRVVAGGARDLEGCKSLKRLKPGNGKLECLNNRGLWQSRFHTWQSRFHTSGGPRRRPCLGEGQGRRISWGIKFATPSDNYVEWDITFSLSSSGIKSTTPSDHSVDWDITFNLSLSGIKSATPSGQYVQADILPIVTFFSLGIKSATPSDHSVDLDIAFNLSSGGIKSATPSDHYVDWDFTFNLFHEGSNSPPPLTTMLNGILPSTYLHQGSNPPLGVLPSTYLHAGSNPQPRPLCWFIWIWPSTYRSSWGIKSATPSDHCIDGGITFNLSSWGIRSATLSDIYVDWDSTFSRHPVWPLCWFGSYLQLICIRDQIRHPLRPICSSGYYL